jgi:hypothetical protein
MTHHTHNPQHNMGISNTGIANSDIDDTTGRHSIFAQIREGMGVYDVRDNHIGSVAFVHFGAASETQQELGTGPASPAPADNPNLRRDTLIDNLAEAFDPNEVPAELQEKLLVSGYLRLDTAGLFASDRFITPEQIASVADDRVYLSVNRDQLVKRH